MNCDIKKILRAQLANELTESVVYGRLAAMQKDAKNREIHLSTTFHYGNVT